jgi:hypothetical protein
MVNYNNSKIYKLICDNSDLIYIGSTTQKLYKRLNEHKKKDCSSKKLFELGNVKIILIEEVKCENKEQLIKREQYYIDKYKNNIINDNNAYTDQKKYNKEYRIKNKDKIKEKRKEWNKEYCIKNKDKIKEYRIKNKDKNKEYYIKNKDIIKEKRKEYFKEYRIKNKDKFKENYQYQKFMDGFNKIDPYLFLT